MLGDLDINVEARNKIYMGIFQSQARIDLCLIEHVQVSSEHEISNRSLSP